MLQLLFSELSSACPTARLSVDVVVQRPTGLANEPSLAPDLDLALSMKRLSNVKL